MAVPVVMPHMGESVVKGKIAAWLKRPGDPVEADEPLVEIETDKINVEVPSPSAGVLLKILAVEEGLVVPVIRDADRLSLLDLSRAIQTLAEKTRQGKVAPGDLEDGTFTITNPGVFGAVISTPIIHPPQAAILAAGRIADVPAVVDGGIGIRKHMFLSLSYDHRVVDGATPVRFLQRVREILEKVEFGRPRGELA